MKTIIQGNRDQIVGAEIGRLLGGEMIKALIESSSNPVTKIPGFAMFYYQVCEIRQTYTGDYFIIFFDVDSLKKTNDRFGHSRGDELLRAFASAVKPFYIRPCDAICHYGGDEFIVYDGRSETLENVSMYAEETRKLFLTFVKHLKLDADVSYGIVTGKDASFRGLKKVIKRADAEMYQMKRRHQEEKARRLVGV